MARCNMIDTITLFINSHDHSQAFCFSKLSSPKFTINENTGEMLQSGYINNLYVRNTGRGILITGSLAKYIFSNNLENPSLQDIETCLKQLSIELNFSLKYALVYRLDIGYNFILESPISYYMACLGDISRFKKTVYNNYETIQYSNSQRTILFYDKLSEAKKRKVDIPDRFKSLYGHILRYELQMKRRLSKQFGFIDGITADCLYNRDFLSVALDKWKSNYFSIRKIYSPVVAINPTKGNLHLLKSLASIGLANVGYDKIMNLLASEKDNLRRQEIYRLKKSVRELLSINSDSPDKDYLSELDKKVRAIEII